MAQIYKYHLFICTHSRDDGSANCGEHDSQSLRDYAKQRVKELKIKRVRVNSAGCLNRCKLGPMCVIYPEGTWYHFETKNDIDDIINSHLINDTIVERLVK